MIQQIIDIDDLSLLSLDMHMQADRFCMIKQVQILVTMNRASPYFENIYTRMKLITKQAVVGTPLAKKADTGTSSNG